MPTSSDTDFVRETLAQAVEEAISREPQPPEAWESWLLPEETEQEPEQK